MTEHRSTSEDELNQFAKWMTFFDEPTYDNNHKDLRNIKHRLSEQFASLELKASFKRGPTNESAVRKPTFEENEENIQEMRRVRKRKKKYCKYLTILTIFSIIVVAVITTTVMLVAPKQSSGQEETSSLSKTTNSVENESVSYLDSVGFNDISSITKTTRSNAEIELESKEKTINSSVNTGELQITTSLISTTELTYFQSSTDTTLSEPIHEMSYGTAPDSSLIGTPTTSISEFYFEISLVSSTTLTSSFTDLETSTYSFESAKQSAVGISTVFSGDIHPTTSTITDPQSPTSLLLESKEKTIKSSVNTGELQITTSLISTTELTYFQSSTDTALSEPIHEMSYGTAPDSSLIETPTTSISEFYFEISLVSSTTLTSSFTDLETSTYSFESAKQSAVEISTVFSGDIHPTTPTITDPRSPTSLLFESNLQPSTRSVQHTASPDIKSSATAASTTQWISSSQTLLETLTVPETLSLLSSTADVPIFTSLLSTEALTGLQVLTPSSGRFESPSVPLISSTLATQQSLGLELSELLLSPMISESGVQISTPISVTPALTNLHAIPSLSLPFQSPSLLMNSLILSTPELFLSLTISVTDLQTAPFISANSAWTDLHELASSSEQLEQSRLPSSRTISMADAQISLTSSLFDARSWTVSDLSGIQMGTSLSMPLQTSPPIHQTASSTNDI
ncbi:hypothetical protein SNE40_001146 [Patella caerulea]|uniref:Uncharacterized protein n=1 Tax=Patella caerulea TaxID=87958 RepID=A0AAN8Q2L0_PATCE